MNARTSVKPMAAFNPLEPGFFDDPYRQYREVREADPVHISLIGDWMLLRYEDCFSLLRNPDTSVALRVALALQPEREHPRFDRFKEVFPDREPRESQGILFRDPPDHTRLRKLVSKVFTPRRVEELRPRVQRLVDDVLDEVGPRGRMDVIADLAFPLPFAVISEMLGMPAADRNQLRDWSHAAVKSLDPIISPEETRAAVLAADQMLGYCAEVIEWKRANLADDLLSALITAEEDGDKLSPDELVDQVTLLFIAGHETTVNLIGNGTSALLRNRDQLEVLRDDPSLDVNAIDELLRFDSPVQFSRRITLSPLQFGGHQIDPGSFVLTCLGGANHDPAQWGPDADRLDVRREGAARHLSFGSGIHHCLGASLARLEGQVAIGSLIRRFPDLEAEQADVAWNHRIILRGIDELPVSFAPVASST